MIANNKSYTTLYTFGSNYAGKIFNTVRSSLSPVLRHLEQVQNAKNEDELETRKVVFSEVLRRYLSSSQPLILMNGFFSVNHKTTSKASNKQQRNNEYLTSNILAKSNFNLQIRKENLEPLISFICVALYFCFNIVRTSIPALTYGALEYETNVVEQDEINEPEKTKCSCPPMFGYVIPADFFGNPLGLQSRCKNNRIHVGQSSEELKVTEDNVGAESYAVLPIGYPSKLEPIISFNWSPKNSSEHNEDSEEVILHASDLDDMQMKNPSDVLEEPEESTYDNDDHPLLKSTHNTEVLGKPVLKEVEDLLANVFSNNVSTSSKHTTRRIRRYTCDPPCSVWCDSSPQSEENTLPNFEHFDINQNEVTGHNVAFNRPALKRSFSANDTIPCRFKDGQFNGFNKMTSEQLSMLRKDPLNYFKKFEDRAPQRFPVVEISLDSCNYKYPSVFNYHEVNQRYSTWHFVAGENSLWKALPECISSDRMMTSTVHKRVRELRRQNSLT